MLLYAVAYAVAIASSLSSVCFMGVYTSLVAVMGLFIFAAREDVGLSFILLLFSFFFILLSLLSVMALLLLLLLLLLMMLSMLLLLFLPSQLTVVWFQHDYLTGENHIIRFLRSVLQVFISKIYFHCIVLCKERDDFLSTYTAGSFSLNHNK